ncbi:MAG: hypothetical protein KTR15_10030 [Phycisphaeraceae bacterium]|nr:hypothetical protein [Phycisphaeraceae bacterium]
MPEIDLLAYFQLAGLGLTWLAAVLAWFWRIKVSQGTDRDIFIILAMVGGFIVLTLLQFIALIYRLG